MIGALASRAASREATTVEEDVTFYTPAVSGVFRGRRGNSTDDGRYGELLLMRIIEKLLKMLVSSCSSKKYGRGVLLTFFTSSPTMTPVFLLRTLVAIVRKVRFPRCSKRGLAIQMDSGGYEAGLRMEW